MPNQWTNSGKEECLKGVHIFVANAANPRTVADTFKVAFFTNAATLTAATTQYGTTNEVSGGGYVAGGATVIPTFTQVTIDGRVRTAIRWDDIEYTSSPTFVFRKALLYNATAGKGNKAIGVWEWTSDQNAAGTTYSIGPKAAINMSPLIAG